MRLDFVRIFLDSTTDTFREVVDPVAGVSSMHMNAKPVSEGDVMAIIGLTGDAQGRVIFDMNLFTAVQLAGRMMEESLPGMSPLARSAIAELASMATGKALSEINDSGVFLKMAPPVVISGLNLESHDGELETLVAPIHTTYGEVRLNVSIQDLK